MIKRNVVLPHPDLNKDTISYLEELVKVLTIELNNIYKDYGEYYEEDLVWNPAELADGEGETSSAISVPQARFGDFVLIGNPYDLQGITCTGYVSADDEVKIRLQNETGDTINLAEGTWYVRVIPRGDV